MYHNRNWSLLTTTRESLYSNEDPVQPKINKIILKRILQTKLLAR